MINDKTVKAKKTKEKVAKTEKEKGRPKNRSTTLQKQKMDATKVNIVQGIIGC